MLAKLPAGTFYGQTEKRCEAAGFTFAETVYTGESNLYLPLHSHENAFLHLVIDGICEEFYGRKTRIGCQSTLAFHPAGEPHSNRWESPGGRVFHVDISQARVEAMLHLVPLPNTSAEIENGVAQCLARKLYREYQGRDQVSLLVMEGLTLEILAEMCRQPPEHRGSKPPRWLLQARDMLHARFTENYSLHEISREVAIHPVHVARAFRRHFGCTPGDYLRKLRIEFACQQLATTELTLIEIALSAGFADQSHFTQTFRRHMRMTPGEFRRIFRSRS